MSVIVFRDNKKKFILDCGVNPLKVNILSIEGNGTITYEVSGTPICQYDQHSRARVGVKFFDYKVSEEPHYILYTKLFDSISGNNEFFQRIKSILEKLEAIRFMAEFKTPFNLMSRACSYKVTQTRDSLKGQMARRLKFCEESFIVGVHWLLRDHLITLDYEGAENFLPGCDSAGVCDYSSADYLSNMFGCLFAGCGRWKSHAEYASFNQSCTTPEEIEKQMHIRIPRSKYELSNGNL